MVILIPRVYQDDVNQDNYKQVKIISKSLIQKAMTTVGPFVRPKDAFSITMTYTLFWYHVFKEQMYPLGVTNVFILEEDLD